MSVWRAIVAVLLLMARAGTSLAGDPAVRVTSATYQTWAGGIARTGGSTYRITLESEHPLAALQIAGMWLDDRYVAFPPGDQPPYHLPTNVAVAMKEKVVEYRILYGTGSRTRETPSASPPSPKPRPSVEGAIVLDLVVDGHPRIVPIAHVESLPPANYP